MVIFFKKGNTKDIKNYIPICLLSNMYKLFTKIITTRLEKKLDENQPREPAGFRSKYSTTYHIHAINQLKEKCHEYNIPMCVAFVDYEKAFDSVQTQAILTLLQEQVGPSAYGPTSIWGVKPSFARMVTNKCFVFCPNKCHICPNWGVNGPPDPPSRTHMSRPSGRCV